jgi:KaiC/GvpD/RAD55 family RecA-like ATPase
MSEVVLKFSEIWQDAIVGYSLKEYPFFINCRTYINYRWFQHPDTQAVVKVLYELYDRLEVKRLIKPEELKQQFVRLHPDVKTQQKFFIHTEKCLKATDQVGLDLMCTDLTTWIKIIKLKSTLLSGEALFNKQDYQAAADSLQKQLRELNNTSFSPDDSVNFLDPVSFFERRTESLKDCVSIGHPLFDDLLIPGASKVPKNASISDANDFNKLTSGGLSKGDCTVLIGASNSGKTSTVLSIISANIKMNKRVLLITHEQKADDIKTRFFENFCAVSGIDLSRVSFDVELQKKLEVAAKQFNDYLTYIPHTKPSEMYVENVLAMIENRQEKLKSQIGAGYDLLVVDYPAKLRSRHFSNKSSSIWEERSFVYDQFYTVCKHYNFHGLFPVQANREGAKINRGDLDRMLEMEDVAEAYNIVQGADNVITINRSVENKESRIIKFYISKSRLSQTGNTFVSETKLEQCRTHGLGLKCGSVYTKSSKEADAYAAANKISDIQALQKLSPADILKYKTDSVFNAGEVKIADKKDLKNLVLQNKTVSYPEMDLTEEDLFSEDEDFYIDE